MKQWTSEWKKQICLKIEAPAWTVDSKMGEIGEYMFQKKYKNWLPVKKMNRKIL